MTTCARIGISRDNGGSRTLTLCRVGIYTIDGSGQPDPGGETASDTTIWSNNGVEYERALDVTFSKVALRLRGWEPASPRRPRRTRRDAKAKPAHQRHRATGLRRDIGSQTDYPHRSQSASVIRHPAFFWLKP